MLIKTYIEALLADEIAADDIWQQWSEHQVNDSEAILLWLFIAAIDHTKTVSGSY
jgi:trans-aconitate methyltransferase